MGSWVIVPIVLQDHHVLQQPRRPWHHANSCVSLCCCCVCAEGAPVLNDEDKATIREHLLQAIIRCACMPSC
jgi:hypothetical protein